ncbi:MAG: F0F1 ATP synthase subunit B [Firmicutes bacterium]|nr:F0F1 ATP synthase subunit B [Bacillota bacterium]
MIELGWTYFFQIVNLLILYLLMKRYLFKPVMGFIEKRREHTEGLLKDADESFSRAKALQADAEQDLNEARRQAQAALEQAIEHGKTIAKELTDQARQEEKNRLERAQKEIEEAKVRAIDEMREEVANLSVQIAGKIVEQKLDEDAHMHLIDEALQRMDDAHVN